MILHALRQVIPRTNISYKKYNYLVILVERGEENINLQTQCPEISPNSISFLTILIFIFSAIIRTTLSTLVYYKPMTSYAYIETTVPIFFCLPQGTHHPSTFGKLQTQNTSINQLSARYIRSTILDPKGKLQIHSQMNVRLLTAQYSIRNPLSEIFISNKKIYMYDGFRWITTLSCIGIVCTLKVPFLSLIIQFQNIQRQTNKLMLVCLQTTCTQLSF